MNYEKLADIAVDIGEIMLKHGAETYRVEDTMRRILMCSGLVEIDAFVNYTGLFVTLSSEDTDTITKFKRIENAGANYNKIFLANRLSRLICDGKISLEDAKKEIQAIRETRVYSEFSVSVSTILIAAMFGVLFGGNALECAIAGVNGILIVIGTKLSKTMKLPGFIGNLLICIAIALVTRFAIVMLGLTGMDQGVIIASSIMPLVPGVAITNAIRDTLHGDYVSGGSRAIEAFLTAAAIAVGIGCGLYLFKISFGGSTFITLGYSSLENEIPFAVVLMIQVLAAFIAVTACSIALFVAKKHLILCGLAGALGWLAYLICEQAGMTVVMKNFFAALVVALLAQSCARLLKAPVTGFLAAGILPMVPGAGMYQIAYHMFAGNQNLTSFYFTQTLQIAGVIALAIFFTESFFRIFQHVGDRKIRKKA